MTQLELLQAATRLDNHRVTLMIEIRDAYRLIQAAKERLETIGTLVEEDTSETLAGMWTSALEGYPGEKALTEQDIATLFAAGVAFLETVETLHEKRPIFGLPESSMTDTPELIDPEVDPFLT